MMQVLSLCSVKFLVLLSQWTRLWGESQASHSGLPVSYCSVQVDLSYRVIRISMRGGPKMQVVPDMFIPQILIRHVACDSVT